MHFANDTDEGDGDTSGLWSRAMTSHEAGVRRGGGPQLLPMTGDEQFHGGHVVVVARRAPAAAVRRHNRRRRRQLRRRVVVVVRVLVVAVYRRLVAGRGRSAVGRGGEGQQALGGRHRYDDVLVNTGSRSQTATGRETEERSERRDADRGADAQQ